MLILFFFKGGASKVLHFKNNTTTSFKGAKINQDGSSTLPLPK